MERKLMHKKKGNWISIATTIVTGVTMTLSTGRLVIAQDNEIEEIKETTQENSGELDNNSEIIDDENERNENLSPIHEIEEFTKENDDGQLAEILTNDISGNNESDSINDVSEESGDNQVESDYMDNIKSDESIDIEKETSTQETLQEVQSEDEDSIINHVDNPAELQKAFEKTNDRSIESLQKETVVEVNEECMNENMQENSVELFELKGSNDDKGDILSELEDNTMNESVQNKLNDSLEQATDSTATKMESVYNPLLENVNYLQVIDESSIGLGSDDNRVEENEIVTDTNQIDYDKIEIQDNQQYNNNEWQIQSGHVEEDVTNQQNVIPISEGNKIDVSYEYNDLAPSNRTINSKNTYFHAVKAREKGYQEDSAMVLNNRIESIKIPSITIINDQANINKASAPISRYRVQSGDTLWKIAQRHGITVEQLMKWNNLSDYTIYINTDLIVSNPNSDSVNMNQFELNNKHTVKEGEYLYKIARNYGVSTNQLRQWNALSVNAPIKSGTVLKVAEDKPIMNHSNKKEIEDMKTVEYSKNVNKQAMIQWFKDREGKATYSMEYRNGPDSYDCSSAVYSALIAAGYLPKGTSLGNTESLFGLEGSLLNAINRSDVQAGDIFISGNPGSSSGAAGHTGVALSNSSIIHMNYSANGISTTPIEGYTGYSDVPTHWFRLNDGLAKAISQH